MTVELFLFQIFPLKMLFAIANYVKTFLILKLLNKSHDCQFLHPVKIYIYMDIRKAKTLELSRKYHELRELLLIRCHLSNEEEVGLSPLSSFKAKVF